MGATDGDGSGMVDDPGAPNFCGRPDIAPDVDGFGNFWMGDGREVSV